jgi:hypothetical protein
MEMQPAQEPVEETPVAQAPVQVKEESEEPSKDELPFTAEEFVDSLAELKDRARAAGLRPVRMMLTSYLNQGLSMVDGLLESLEGSKKKGK